MSLPRRPSWLLLPVIAGAAAFFAGRWAHEGLLPVSRPVNSTAPPPKAAPREPQVAPDSKEGTWMQRVKAAAPGDYAALLDDLDATFPPGENYEARDAAQKWLLGLWIARDADAAAEYVAAKKSDLLGCSFGLVLGSVAPGKVSAHYKPPPDKTFGQYFASAVMRSLSAADPHEYLRLAETAGATAPPRNWARALVAIAATDPQAAATAWLRWGRQGGGQAALVPLLETWHQQDAAAARRWAESLEDESARDLAHHTLLRALVRQDPAAARRALAEEGWLIGEKFNTTAAALTIADPRVELAALTARHDLPAAIADLAAMDEQIKASTKTTDYLSSQPESADPRVAMRRAIVDAAAASLPDDPAALFAALDHLRTGDDAAQSPGALSKLEADLLKRKLQGRDAATLLEAAQLATSRLVAGGETQLFTHEWLPGFITTAARDDPARTAAFISALPAEQRGFFAETALGMFGASDPGTLAQVAAFVPAQQWNRDMGNRLAIAPEVTAPAMAALPENAQTGLARHAFAESWARRDPGAATLWVASMPQDGRVTQAARGLTDAWASYDDTAASAWADTLPPGPARDGAARGLAAAVAAAEPEAAWQWAASVSDPALAADAYWNIARQWGRDAPPEFQDAFSTALDHGGYSGDIKERALRDLTLPRQLTAPPP